MGAHSSAESLLAGVESDAIRIKAIYLAAMMNQWLTAPVTERTPFDDWPDSVLMEWCRSARDILEAVGRG